MTSDDIKNLSRSARAKLLAEVIGRTMDLRKDGKVPDLRENAITGGPGSIAVSGVTGSNEEYLDKVRGTLDGAWLDIVATEDALKEESDQRRLGGLFAQWLSVVPEEDKLWPIAQKMQSADPNARYPTLGEARLATLKTIDESPQWLTYTLTATALLGVLFVLLMTLPTTKQVSSAPTPPQTPALEINTAAGKMRLVLGGEFDAGASEDHGGRGIRRVTVKDFYLDVNEFAVALYDRYSGPAPWPSLEAQPVSNVGWADADRTCRSVGKRLPTGDEWERAARGTRNTAFVWGDDERVPNGINIDGPQLADAGASPADRSEFGVMDLAGNLPEWVNGPGLTLGEMEVRGGGYFLPSKFARAGLWMSLPTNLGSHSARVGFRCACDIAAGAAVEKK